MSSSSATPRVDYVTALDGLVNVNSLFTAAVFMGLTIAAPGQKSLEERSSCDAGTGVARKLVLFEICSFSFFLVSSLLAQGLKLAIILLNSTDVDRAFKAHVNLKVLRVGMMGSAGGCVLGCVFLLLSMVKVIEIRLGIFSCGSGTTANGLMVLVSLALVLYMGSTIYVFFQ